MLINSLVAAIDYINPPYSISITPYFNFINTAKVFVSMGCGMSLLSWYNKLGTLSEGTGRPITTNKGIDGLSGGQLARNTEDNLGINIMHNEELQDYIMNNAVAGGFAQFSILYLVFYHLSRHRRPMLNNTKIRSLYSMRPCFRLGLMCQVWTGLFFLKILAQHSTPNKPLNK